MSTDERLSALERDVAVLRKAFPAMFSEDLEPPVRLLPAAMRLIFGEDLRHEEADVLGGSGRPSAVPVSAGLVQG